jgi:uncharacterized protein
MSETIEQSYTEELRERITRAAGGRLRHIILFGSRVAGRARNDSDYDVLVIEKDPVAKRLEGQRLRRALRDLPFPVDVHVMGETEFEETRRVIGGIAYPAATYGIFLA